MDSASAPNGSEPLSRLLSQEANVANLLAYLSERDPAPLLTKLGLVAVNPAVRQEVSQGTSGRFDLVVTNSNEPIALIELKVGAKQHGNQYERYNAWSMKHGDIPCYLVSLDENVPDAPRHWKQLLITDLLKGWSTSSDERARVIASAADDALLDVLTQAAGRLGLASRTAVALAFRHLDRRVRELAPELGLAGGAERTSGGQPALVFYAVHPAAESDREHLCVDLRSEAASRVWKLRLGVEVWLTREDDGTIVPGSHDHARVRAHDLALALGNHLRTSALTAHLAQRGRSDLAAMIRPSRGDGLIPGTPTATALDKWRAAAATGSLKRSNRKLQPHPKFKHDDGRRLVSISHIAYQDATVEQLATLVETSLRYLNAGATVEPLAVRTHETTS